MNWIKTDKIKKEKKLYLFSSCASKFARSLQIIFFLQFLYIKSLKFARSQQISRIKIDKITFFAFLNIFLLYASKFARSLKMEMEKMQVQNWYVSKLSSLFCTKYFSTYTFNFFFKKHSQDNLFLQSSLLIISADLEKKQPYDTFLVKAPF